MKIKISLLFALICITWTPSYAAVKAPQRLLYGLTNEGKIYAYNQDSNKWELFTEQLTHKACHIAAGPHGQLYAIDGTPSNNACPLLLDRGTIYFRSAITATASMGKQWVAMPYSRNIIGVAAGNSKVIACDEPNQRDIIECARPTTDGKIFPWGKIKGTAYGVAANPANDTQYIIDDWRINSVSNVVSMVFTLGLFRPVDALVGKILQRNQSNWNSIEKPKIANGNQIKLGEEGWGIVLYVSVSDSNLIHITATENTLWGTGADASLWFWSPTTGWKAIDKPFSYGSETLVGTPLTFVTATSINGIDEVFCIQKATVHNVEKSTQRSADKSTQVTTQTTTERNISKNCIWHRTGITKDTKEGTGWELVYDFDSSTNQKLSFREIAVGSVEYTPEELAAIKKAEENAKAAAQAKKLTEEKAVAEKARIDAQAKAAKAAQLRKLQMGGGATRSKSTSKPTSK